MLRYKGGGDMAQISVEELFRGEGDFVSGITDTEPPSCYAEVQHENS